MQSKMTSRKQFWVDHINKQQKANISQAEYCRQNNLKKGSFSSMKNVLSAEGLLTIDQKNQEKSFFIEANSNQSTISNITVKLPSGIEIKIENVSDHLLIAKILSSMENSHAFHQ